jgi:hypothetical protein
MANVLTSLRAWAKRGPSYDGREEHKGDKRLDEHVKSSSPSSDSSSESVPWGASDAEKDNSEEELDDSAEEKFCELCFLAHSAEKCPLVQEHSEALATLLLQPSTIQRVAVHGNLRIMSTQYVMRDVAPDGDCMFHAIGKELADKYPNELPHDYVASPQPGPFWRQFLLSYVRTTDDLIDMVPVKVSLVVACEHPHFECSC